MIPRYYQQQANDAVWDFLSNQPGSPLVVLPTGAGKSLVIAMLVEQARKFNARVIVLQHRKELIQQNAEKIQMLLPDIKIGINSAGLRRHSFDDDVVCCGIQSVYRKAHEFGRRELILIDEVHLVGSNDDSMYGQFLHDIRAINERARLVGLTATPFRTSEGPICGSQKLFQRICYESFTGDLIKEGYLCPITNKPAGQTVDTSGIKKRGGEFINSDAAKAFDIDEKVNAACVEIVDKCHDRHSVLVFSSGVEHAEHVATVLQELTAERVGVVTGETFPMERQQLLADFRDNRLRWLVNCDVLCLDEKTEILTSGGWVGIDEMTPLHQVASWEIDNSIVFEPPKTIVRRPRLPFEKMVSLKTNGVDIRVTSNHRMIYEKGLDENRRWEITPAENLVGRPVRLPAHGFAMPFDCEPAQDSATAKQKQARVRSLSYVYRSRDGLTTEDAKREAVAFVGGRDLMGFKSPGELTDSECQLIGFWIGDGTKSGGRVSISQSTAYPDNVSYVDSLLALTRIAHSRKVYKPTTKTENKSVRWTFARGTGSKQQRVEKGYYHIEPYLEKSGTSLFWGLGNFQVLSLLKGLWLADGLHHAKHKRNSITTVNKPLIDLLQAICTCRGIRTSIRKLSFPRKENHRQQWCFSWDLTAHAIKTQKKRFALELDPAKEGERVWCVTSITGKIITRRNGKVAVVGNTTGFDAPCIDAIAVLRATMSPGLFAQIVGRGLRKHESKTECLVLDFGENIKRHGSIDDPNYGRAESGGSGGGGGAEQNGRGKPCPNCEIDVAANAGTCPECGFEFPRDKEPRHGDQADTESTLTGLPDPENWEVISCSWCRWTKKKDPEAPPTLRVTYEVRPLNSPDGNLANQHVSEWVCFEHVGFARAKAEQWWHQRSMADCPETIADAITCLDRGMARMASMIETLKEGRWQRITSVTFNDEVPLEMEWLPEPEEIEDEDYSFASDEVPF